MHAPCAATQLSIQVHGFKWLGCLDICWSSSDRQLGSQGHLSLPPSLACMHGGPRSDLMRAWHCLACIFAAFLMAGRMALGSLTGLGTLLQAPACCPDCNPPLVAHSACLASVIHSVQDGQAGAAAGIARSTTMSKMEPCAAFFKHALLASRCPECMQVSGGLA